MSNFHKLAALGLLSISATAQANTINTPSHHFSIPNGYYAGIFGGGGNTSGNNLNQTGTALYSAGNGGPLAVNANGSSDSNFARMLGAHVGYEWKNLPGVLVPSVELEGYYLGTTMSGKLSNPTTRLPEHLFDDSFPMNMGVLLANTVWTIKTPFWNRVNPYGGVGIGTGYISISGANSKQAAPAEAGVNHFNSNTDASDWAFAVQAKAGLRFLINDHWRMFAEYRFLYLSDTHYTFGSTQYPTHVATTNWRTSIGGMNYNMGVAGVEYSF